MDEGPVTVRFDARNARLQLKRILEDKENKIKGLTKDPQLYVRLSEEYHYAIRKFLPFDSKALAYNLQGVTSVKTSRPDKRYGRISFNSKGIRYDPVSIFEPKTDRGKPRITHYAGYVEDKIKEVTYAGGPGWSDFIEKAKPIVKERFLDE